MRALRAILVALVVRLIVAGVAAAAVFASLPAVLPGHVAPSSVRNMLPVIQAGLEEIDRALGSR